MAEFLDLTGSIFGRLKVIKMDRKVQSGKRERYYWNCVCECGKNKISKNGLLNIRICQIMWLFKKGTGKDKFDKKSSP